MRRIASIGLVTLACLLAPLSLVAVWAKGEVTNTDRWVATVAPLASKTDVQAAVTARLTTEIFTYVDIDAITKDAVDTLGSHRNLTPKQEASLTSLAAPLKAGIESFTQGKIADVVSSATFATAWTDANTVAHTQIDKVLSGQQDGAVTVANNQVTLNLGDVVAEVKNELVADGFNAASKIPPVDAQLVLFQSDRIGQLQQAYSALNLAGFVLPLVALAFAIIGVVVANRRRTALLGLGLGLAVSMAITALALAVDRNIYSSDLPASVNQPAALAVFDAAAGYLHSGVRVLFVIAVAVVLAAFFAGPSRIAVSTRELFARSK